MNKLRKLSLTKSRLGGILYPATILLFFAFTFQSIPPGWYQQTLPRTDVLITDIYFIDSLKGWATARKNTNDSAYIFYTSNGGNNWSIQYQNKYYLTALQLINENTGYSVGSAPPGVIIKTTDGGINWFNVTGLSAYPLTDLFFTTVDTGWVCSDDLFDGGVYKTTNGGINWQLQLGVSFRPSRLFFINNDTGWSVCQNIRLFKTTNSGQNWIQQVSFPTGINNMYFINKNIGWLANTSSNQLNGIFKTTNGGQNWVTQIDPTPTGSGNNDVYFVDSLKGWIACGFAKILHTTDGGENWFVQTTPKAGYTKIQFIDSNKGWSAGSQIVHTTDGGGLSAIEQIGNEMPSEYKLFQNYPNPFNPNTKIRFSVKRQTTNVKLLIYNSIGEFIFEAFNGKLSAGTYEVQFNANNLSSGVYYYTLITDNFKETKKMLLIK
ncbi:MAG TPA: YCF48-related protein [Ignavibacteria bacterium]|nr:YCF48-related protein [Ignavibacteria bacterium]